MPQLIAMVIVVVGAMIYMFQTFGGTGDKLEGVAQKSSIITEINNIKDGLIYASEAEQIAQTASAATDTFNTLSALGGLKYFDEQINEQVVDNANATDYPTTNDDNAYYGISFGGQNPDNQGGVVLKLVSIQNMVPGIFVDLSSGNLKDNAPFLETQIAKDLEVIAYIDRGAQDETDVGSTAQDTTSTTGILTRIPADKDAATDAQRTDGKFIVYFKDFGPDKIVK